MERTEKEKKLIEYGFVSPSSPSTESGEDERRQQQVIPPKGYFTDKSGLGRGGSGQGGSGQGGRPQVGAQNARALQKQQQSQEQQPPSAQKTFFMTCGLCDWVSQDDTDFRSLPFFEGQLKCHMLYAHGVGGDTSVQNSVETSIPGQDHEVKEKQEYETATQPKEFPEGVDDGCSRFHEARFLSGPLNYQNCEKQMPLEGRPFFSGRSLMHINVPTQDTTFIKQVNNRASRRINKLEKFSQDNLSRIDIKKKYNMEEDGVTVGENVLPCNEKHDLLIAALNFMELRREFHGNEVGPRALFRVLLDKLLDASCTVTMMKSFFANITDENAGRAVRGEGSLTYQECCARWITLSQSNQHLKAEEEERKKREKSEKGRERYSSRYVTQDVLDRALVQVGRGGNHTDNVRARSSSGQGRGAGAPPPKSKRYPFCGPFNEASGCKNRRISDDKCQSTDLKIWKHSCKVKLQNGTICKAFDHGAFQHP